VEVAQEADSQVAAEAGGGRRPEWAEDNKETKILMKSTKKEISWYFLFCTEKKRSHVCKIARKKSDLTCAKT